MAAAISVVAIRHVRGNGTLKALVDVQIGCLLIRGCRILQQPDREPWLALPQVPLRVKASGEGAGWQTVVEITNPDVRDQLASVAIRAWQAAAQEPARSNPHRPG